MYALGVILYELLAGRLPYDISRTRLHEAIQTIRETEPVPLSSVQRIYRGDIETMVAKTLEKDKTRRYSSAADLAADLRRYLADEPIVARPASTAYQLRKFARRHTTLVAGVAAVFVVLLAGVAVSTREALRADREAAAANALNDFLRNDLLAQAGATTQAGPAITPDPDLKVRTALDRAALRISGKFDKQPLVEASIRKTLGDAFLDLGLYQEAQRQLERAVDLTQRSEGDKHPDTLNSMSSLASVYHAQSKYPQAEELQAKVTEVRRGLLGEEHPDTLKSMLGLASAYERDGKYVQAEPLYRKVLRLDRRVLGEDNPQTLRR